MDKVPAADTTFSLDATLTVAIVTALLTAAGVYLPIYLSRGGRQSRRMKRTFKHIAALSESLNTSLQSTSSRERLVIEETVAAFYGGKITIEEIEVLLRALSPSTALREYMAAKKYGGVRVETGQVYLQGYWQAKKTVRFVDVLKSPHFITRSSYLFFTLAGSLLVIYSTYALTLDEIRTKPFAIGMYTAAIAVGLTSFGIGVWALIAGTAIPDRDALRSALQGTDPADAAPPSEVNATEASSEEKKRADPSTESQAGWA